ncbi:TonB-dependent receptor [Aequoribacter fuscus]|uniref:TonB-dependent receptor n=1 Tax=Aequoribacter fuscus TaxID=2518989 RepID=F3KYK6_9GAMM|nr:TonB-dependent receptor [Aequoribacter fuscus]EGG30837.1 TonB-dependent receptor [Aequoribacter fuscus]QHJ87741.1 TonB-dependent receptor [Aequoribacter fuscus]
MRKTYLAAHITALIAVSSGLSVNTLGNELVLEEVIVTAQKRDQSSQDVPIAITAVSADDMERIGATEIKDIQFSTPSLSVVGGNPVLQSYGIRGVADRGRNPGYDQRVGVYVDGVWVGKSAASNQSALDVASIEVLNGPQGTLFGKNTVAGAININTKRPGDQFAASVSVDVGNYDFTHFKASVNVPFSDTVTGKVSVSKLDRDGYIDNINPTASVDEYSDRDEVAVRAQLLWNLGDSTEVYFTADHFESEFNDNGYELGSAVDAFTPDAYEVNLDAPSAFNVDGVGGLSVGVTHMFDNGFELTSITAKRYEKWSYEQNDADLLPFDIAQSDTSADGDHFTQEIRLASPEDENFNYVVGLYYLNQDIDGDGSAYINVGPFHLTAGNTAKVENQSWAAFVHSNYQLTEALQLTAGVRYTEETKDIDYMMEDSSGQFIAPAPGVYTRETFSGDREASDWSPKVSLNWFVNDDIMVYGSYAKAFKSGGYNADFVGDLRGLEFDDEEVDAYELGIKTTLLEGRLRMNAAVFHSEHTDYQVSAQLAVAPGRSIITVTNAGALTSEGFEVDVEFLATDWLRIWGSYGYADATFDEYDNCNSSGLDCGGNQAPDAPKVNFNFGAEVTTPMSDGEIFANAQYFYRDEMYSNPANTDVSLGEDYNELSGRIGWRSNSGEWTVYAWGKNLTREEAEIYNVLSFLQSPASQYNVPRTYGVSVKWNYGN